LSLRKKVKKIKNNPWVLWLWNEQRRFKGELAYQKISDEEYIQQHYLNAHGMKPNLVSPKTFNEKLSWLKIHYRDPIMTECADKYGVRKYIEDRGLGYLLNDLLAVYESVEEINIQELPERFVLKGSHGSGWNLIVKDKNKINWFAWKLVMKSWMKQNIYYYGREWVYKDIKPRIICEKYLEDANGELNDYKIFCFNGEPRVIQVDVGRFVNHTRNLYSSEWDLMPFTIGYENSDKNVERPKNLSEMLKISRILASSFPHVRVDFYEVNGRLYFGELTFFHESGTGRFSPIEYDNLFGDWLRLPSGN
jgi:hypothetical protein